MRRQLNIIVVFFGLAASVSPAGAQVMCGGVIKTSAVLTSDLLCTMDNPALTVQGSGGALDMNGFELSCGGSRATGIKLTGSRATLRNGTVSDCGGAVVLLGSSGHQVSNMTLQNNSGNGLSISRGSGHQINETISRDNRGRGFVISGGGNNSFIGNAATGTASHGFEVIRSNNIFTSNQATNNGIMGFQVRGSGNTFDRNTVDRSGKDGLNIFGDNNELTGNTVRDVLHDGINLKPGAGGNTISNNDASGNGIGRAGAFDLKDENADCGSNTWTQNTGTRNQPICIK